MEQVAVDAASAPCKDSDRLNAVKDLFQKLGVQDSDSSVQNLDGVENYVITKQGQSQDTIVIGAHYDKTPDGCGAVDNWTGVVALAHIYRTLKDTPMQKTIVFVAFGKEEKGLLGSKAMVNSIAKERLGDNCAMINIDSLGLGAPQVATNISSKKLADLTSDIAKKMKIPFGQGPVGGSSDSWSFLDKNIPAVTIHGLAGGYESIIHTAKDKADKVIAESVYLGYRLALALAVELDNSTCDANK